MGYYLIVLCLCSALACQVYREGGETELYKVRPEICDLLIAEAGKSAQKRTDRIKPGAVLSFDGSSSHSRAAKHCFGSFLETDIKKIIDFKMIEIHNFERTYQGMQGETVRRMSKHRMNQHEISLSLTGR
jgi:hypothetical protein